MDMYLAWADCYGCQRPFGFNPRFVPSFKGAPVCPRCMEMVNLIREARGEAPHPVHAKAYEPAPKSEVA